MRHVPPNHLVAAGICTGSASFAWDEVFSPAPDLSVHDLLGGLRHRAALALTLGCAEWVVWCLAERSSPTLQLALDVIEAGWAAVADRRHFRLRSSSRFSAKTFGVPDDTPLVQDLFRAWKPKDYLDPRRGPLALVVQWVAEAVDASAEEYGGIGFEPVYLSALARHVLGPKAKAFLTWRRDAMKRLLSKHRLRLRDDKESARGTPLPPGFMAPGFVASPSQTAKQVEAFLASLDPSQNRFLHLPKSPQRPPGIPRDATFVFEWNEWSAGERDAQGRFHGLVKSWRQDGTFAEEATFAHGKPHGLKRRFYENGKPSSDEHSRQGSTHRAVAYRPTSSTNEAHPFAQLPRSVVTVGMEYTRDGWVITQTLHDKRGALLDLNGRKAPKRPSVVPTEASLALRAVEGTCWHLGDWRIVHGAEYRRRRHRWWGLDGRLIERLDYGSEQWGRRVTTS